MKPHLPTALRRALLAALAVAALAPAAWAETFTLTQDTSYTYGEGDWKPAAENKKTAFKSEDTEVSYTFTSNPEKEFSLSFSGGTAGVFLNLYESDDSSTFDYLTFTKLNNLSFSGNVHDFEGGAIYSYYGDITLSENTGAITFSGNKSELLGGVIYIYKGDITLSENKGSIEFSDNTGIYDGGAIYSCRGDISLTENGDITISGNQAGDNGGAIYTLIGNISLTKNEGHIEVSGNESEHNGGAIYSSSGNITLSENTSITFSGNSSSNGGAIYNVFGDIALTKNKGNIEFSDNTSEYEGGAICSYYGNITLSENTGAITFSGNEAGSDGGAIATSSGNITLSGNGAVTFSGNTATNNNGGALYSYDGTIKLSENTGAITFSENSAGLDGGVIFSGFGDIEFSSNTSTITFSNNEAGQNGGVIYKYEGHVTLTTNSGDIEFAGNKAEGGGGVINNEAGAVLLTKNSGDIAFSDNKAGYDGGAIRTDDGAITLSGNTGTISFSGNEAKGDGGAIRSYSGAITLTENTESITFSGNKAEVYGGAIYTSVGDISLTKNKGSIEFSGNQAEDAGGAISSDSGNITLSENEAITFSGNESEVDGGAIYGDEGAISLTKNKGAIEFSDNTSEDDGGAVYSRNGISLEGNAGAILFTRNKAEGDDGGAIYAGEGDINLTGNGNITFTENTTVDDGGAIYAGEGDITLSGNGDILFSGNRAADYGAALYASNNKEDDFTFSISIVGNNSVVFEKNVETGGEGAEELVFRLRSVYMSDTDSVLTLSAEKGKHISFYDTIYAAGIVDINAYTDADGRAQTSAGTIRFDAAEAEAHLKEAKGSAGTEEEIIASRTSEILGKTMVYGGRLEVLNGAILTGGNDLDGNYSNGGLELASNSNATLYMRNARIDKAVTLNSSTTMELEGANTVATLNSDLRDVSFSFTLSQTNKTQAALTLDSATALTLNPELITVTGAGSGKYMLIDTGVSSSGWLAGQTDPEFMYWQNGILYYKSSDPVAIIAETATSPNATAAAALLTAAEEGNYAADGALAGVFEAADNETISDRDLAAVAGASAAVLAQALSGDVERQLRAIRNRSISGAYGRDAVALNDGKGGAASMPESNRYFAWVNAEGNRAEQNADGCAAGYTLSSWGGTVGAGMQVDNQLTLGLALTAMYGDLQSDGPDGLDGDMDTAYLSAFARYNSGNWSHAFIGTVGTMEADYKRTAMGYSNTGDTEGMAFGLMYELSRDYALSNNSSISPVFNISYRHIAVDGYSERGTDAALNVGEQSLDTVTVGLGARYAAVLGQQTLNRACAFEARALAKYDFGDTQTDTNVGFINHATRAGIKSAELGAFGVELGAGISVPVGSGSIFADGAVELRSDYTNFNATVGYRVEF